MTGIDISAAMLGKARAAGPEGHIVLSDDGGNPYGSIIGADAIRAVRTSLVC